MTRHFWRKLGGGEAALNPLDYEEVAYVNIANAVGDIKLAQVRCCESFPARK